MRSVRTKKKIVISASRRTDIPAFYMDWFMAGIKRGVFEVENPFSRAKSLVPADPETVHSIVFWSKDYARFLERDFGRILQSLGYHLFFHFTINSRSGILEARTPDLPERLNTLAELAGRFGPDAVTWRFDPICHFIQNNRLENNLGDFLEIADAAARAGVTRCVTSFLDIYKKINARCARMENFAFQAIPLDKQARILLRMEDALRERGLRLFTCCEKDALGLLPPESSIRPSACMDHALLERLFGPGLSGKQDRGQRVSQGCGCMESQDIGSYSLHPCWRNCLYCYANPKAGAQRD